ncbi:MAG: DUF4837 family protein [Bacteroidaceae bacterium]|nr:DUF4837 family protein [Bacteroidaceae bacterium]
MRKLLFCIVTVLMVVSCKDGHLAMPQASGRPYEVLVVMDPVAWEAPEGRALFDVLDTNVPGLPQPERSFYISQVAPEDMNRTLSIFRNIIEVHIDPTQFTTTRMKFVRNEYAEGQVVLYINSDSPQSFAQHVTEHRQDIIDFFTKMEINRLCKDLERRYSKLTYDLVKEIFGCEWHAPEELKNFKRGKDFLWTTNNTATGMVSIVMYSYPYEGPETFNKQYVLHKRDSVMRVNLPGSEPDMYVQTDTAFTEVRPIVVHHKYAMEARGLWYMRNDAMGGPFVSHSRVDTENNRVIVVEGFVFAPEKMKRGLMRRMEGSLYMLRLPEELKDEEQEDEEETNLEEEASPATPAAS